MATKKKTKTTTAAKAEKPKKLPVGKGPLGYTTSNVFKAPIAKVWAAATEKKHLKKHFVDDMQGEFSSKLNPVTWIWKEWGGWTCETVKYVKNKELIFHVPVWGEKYQITVRFEILKKDGKTIFRVHESGYPANHLKNAFMMCEGWSEFHTAMKAYLMGVDLRKA